MDYQVIGSLSTDEKDMPKYKYKRWVKIQDSNRGRYTADSPIKYSCETLQDKLVDYSSGYIMILGTINAADAANAIA